MSTNKSTESDCPSILRLEEYRQRQSKDMPSFCKALGIRYNTYHAAVRRTSALSEDVLKSIALNTSMSLHWLLTGEGEMETQAPPGKHQERFTPGPGEVAVRGEYLEVLKDNYELSKLRTLGLERELMELKNEIARLERMWKEEAGKHELINEVETRRATK